MLSVSSAGGPAPRTSPALQRMRGAEGWKVNDGLRALVVDPEPANRRQLRALLAEQGYRVVLAATGDEALEQAARIAPAGRCVNRVRRVLTRPAARAGGDDMAGI